MPRSTIQHVFAAIWSIDTLTALGDGTLFANKTLTEKLQLLEAAVQCCYANCEQAATSMDLKKCSYVFLAPEYYFVKAIAPGAARNIPPVWTLFDKNEMENIEKSLQKISKKYPKMLLVPGTINWKKKVPSFTKYGKLINFQGFSTTVIFYRGKSIHHYDKKFDDGNFNDRTTDVAFAPGTNSQLFEFEKLRCGIEVCGDNTSRNLAKEAAAQSLDLEFYISATNPHEFTTSSMAAYPVRDGGYLLHCDAVGVKEKNGVWAIQRNRGWHGTPLTMSSPRPTKGLLAWYDPWSKESINLMDTAAVECSRSMLMVVTTRDTKSTTSVPSPAEAPAVLSKAAGLGSSSKLLAPRLSSSHEKLGLDEPKANLLELQLTELELTDGLKDNSYKMTLSVKLTNPPGSQASVEGRTIRFTASNGSATPAEVDTTSSGIARTVYTLTKSDDEVELAANFLNAEVKGTVKFHPMGVGQVSKLGKLQMLNHGQYPCWYLPI